MRRQLPRQYLFLDSHSLFFNLILLIALSKAFFVFCKAIFLAKAETVFFLTRHMKKLKKFCILNLLPYS